jgi:hypothetical protein
MFGAGANYPGVRWQHRLRPLSGFGDHLQRQDFHLATPGKLCLLGVTLEKVAALQRLDGLVVGCGSEVKVVDAVATLHAAIRDFALQAGVGVQGGDELGDAAVPFVLRNFFALIFDQKIFHVVLTFLIAFVFNDAVAYKTGWVYLRR